MYNLVEFTANDGVHESRQCEGVVCGDRKKGVTVVLSAVLSGRAMLFQKNYNRPKQYGG